MTKELKKKQKKEEAVRFIEECIADYEAMANEYENLAKQYRSVAKFWKERYDDMRTRTGVLAPLFVDDVNVKNVRKVTFKNKK